MPNDKSPDTVVVTGSSTGIGRAIALRLAGEGYRLILHGREPSVNLKETAEQARQLNVPVSTICADFSIRDGADRFFELVVAESDGFKAWINNAGADILTGDQDARSFVRDFEQLWMVDVRATLSLSRQVAEHMRRQAVSSGPVAANAGSIVNIGWDQASTGIEGESGLLFSTTKGAIMAMTASLAKTYAPWVRVNCVAPGWIQTEWGEQASEYWQRRACNESLLGRWGTPQDVANTIAFLISEQAGFINGQILAVNGGFAGGLREEPKN